MISSQLKVSLSHQEELSDFCRCFSTRKKMEQLRSKCRTVAQLEKDALKRDQIVAKLRLTLQEHIDRQQEHQQHQQQNSQLQPKQIPKRASGPWKTSSTTTTTKKASQEGSLIPYSPNPEFHMVREMIGNSELKPIKEFSSHLARRNKSHPLILTTNKNNNENDDSAEGCDLNNSNAKQESNDEKLRTSEIVKPKIGTIYYQSATLTAKNQQLEKLNQQLLDDKILLTKKLRELEKAKKNLMEKNRKILMKSVDYNNEHRRLEMTLKSLSDENNKLVEIQNKNRQQILNINGQLYVEKHTNVQLRQKLEDLEILRQKMEEYLKVIAALRESALEKDKRIENLLAIVRKRRLRNDLKYQPSTNDGGNNQYRIPITSDEADSLGPFDDENLSSQSESSNENQSTMGTNIASNVLTDREIILNHNISSALDLLSSPESNLTLRQRDGSSHQGLYKLNDPEELKIYHNKNPPGLENLYLPVHPAEFAKFDLHHASSQLHLTDDRNVLNAHIAELVEAKTKLEMDLKEARDQIDLFEFRILELEDGKRLSTLTRANEHLVEENQTLGDRISQYETTLAEYRAKMEDLENDNVKIGARLIEYQITVNNFDDRFGNLSNAKCKVDSENEILKNQINLLEGNNQSLVRELDIYKSDVHNKEDPNSHVYAELSLKYETLRDEHEKCTKTSDSMADEMEQSLNENETLKLKLNFRDMELAELKDNIQANHESIESIKRGHEVAKFDFKGQIELLSSQKRDMASQLEKEELRYKQLLKCYNQNQTEMEKLGSAFAMAKEEGTELTNSLNNYVRGNERILISNEALTQDMALAKTKISDLGDTLNEKDLELHLSIEKIRYLDEQIRLSDLREGSLKIDLSKLKREVDAMQADLANINFIDEIMGCSKTSAMPHHKPKAAGVEKTPFGDYLIAFEALLDKLESLETTLRDYYVDLSGIKEYRYINNAALEDENGLTSDAIWGSINQIRHHKHAIEAKIMCLKNIERSRPLDLLVDEDKNLAFVGGRVRLLKVIDIHYQYYDSTLQNYVLLKNFMSMKLREGELIEMINEKRNADGKLVEIVPKPNKIDAEAQCEELKSHACGESSREDLLNCRIRDLEDKERRMSVVIRQLSQSELALKLTLAQADDMICRRETMLHEKIGVLEEKEKILAGKLTSLHKFKQLFGGSDSCLTTGSVAACQNPKTFIKKDATFPYRIKKEDKSRLRKLSLDRGIINTLHGIVQMHVTSQKNHNSPGFKPEDVDNYRRKREFADTLKMENAELKKRLEELDNIQNIYKSMENEFVDTKNKLKKLEDNQMESETSKSLLNSQLQWLNMSNQAKDKIINALRYSGTTFTNNNKSAMDATCVRGNTLRRSHKGQRSKSQVTPNFDKSHKKSRLLKTLTTLKVIPKAKTPDSNSSDHVTSTTSDSHTLDFINLETLEDVTREAAGDNNFIDTTYINSWGKCPSMPHSLNLSTCSHHKNDLIDALGQSEFKKTDSNFNEIPCPDLDGSNNSNYYSGVVNATPCRINYTNHTPYSVKQLPACQRNKEKSNLKWNYRCSTPNNNMTNDMLKGEGGGPPPNGRYAKKILGIKKYLSLSIIPLHLPSHQRGNQVYPIDSSILISNGRDPSPNVEDFETADRDSIVDSNNPFSVSLPTTPYYNPLGTKDAKRVRDKGSKSTSTSFKNSLKILKHLRRSENVTPWSVHEISYGNRAESSVNVATPSVVSDRNWNTNDSPHSPPTNFYIKYVIGTSGIALGWTKYPSKIKYPPQSCGIEGVGKKYRHLLGYKISVNATECFDINDPKANNFIITHLDLSRPIYFSLQATYSDDLNTKCVYALYKGYIFINNDPDYRQNLQNSAEHKKFSRKFTALYGYKMIGKRNNKGLDIKSGYIVEAIHDPLNSENFYVKTKNFNDFLSTNLFEK